MNLLDRLALRGRRYERQTVPGTGSERFSLAEVLTLFNHDTILELTPVVDGKDGATEWPDAVRKIKVSLLDKGISAIPTHTAGWYEVFRTAPSGDVSRVRIVAYSPDNVRVGEIRMVVSHRLPQYYFDEDPLLKELDERQ